MTGVQIDRAAVGALRTLVDDHGRTLAEQMLEIFARDAPLLVTQLHRAAAAEDQTELLRLAHRLKGSASTMGAVTVADHCRQLDHCVNAAQYAEVAALLDALSLATAETMRLLQAELDRPLRP